MKISINIPEYSVEQGIVTLNGLELPHNLQSKITPMFYGMVYGNKQHSNPIKTIRRVLFQPANRGRWFTITKKYPEEARRWLNNTKEGYCDYKTALKLFHEVKAGAMEGAIVTIKSKLRG